MSYVYLLVAVVFEVIATSSLKASQEFTRLWPSVLTIVGYMAAFYLLSLCLRTIPLGVMYAIWAGLGVALTMVVGFVVYQERLDGPAVIGIAFILGGVAIIRLYSKSAAQVV